MVRDGHVLCTCMVMFSQSNHPISHIIFFKVYVVSHILKFLHKFNNSYDHFFYLILGKLQITPLKFGVD